DCASVMIGGETLSSDVLIERVGLARAEHENLRDGVPFGERNEEWENLKSAIEPGDNIWFYRDNRTITGAEGYVVVRDCEVVAFFMTTKY
ncbi:MAG: hypothetical protein R3338_10895, partial [Thermoanaerobaculia bacterium]|nr:hypothetical protein [Thermoanaerobaculia bacterium]